jgi:hypothetical protein
LNVQKKEGPPPGPLGSEHAKKANPPLKKEVRTGVQKKFKKFIDDCVAILIFTRTSAEASRY